LGKCNITFKILVVPSIEGLNACIVVGFYCYNLTCDSRGDNIAFFVIGILRELFVKKNKAIVKNAIKEIDYYTIVLLAGLFVVIGGIKNAGVIDVIGNAISSLGSGSVFVIYTIIVWMSVLLSAFIDNIPYTATML